MVSWILYGDTIEYYRSLEARFKSPALHWFGAGKHELKKPFNMFKNVWKSIPKDNLILVIGSEVKYIGMKIDLFILRTKYEVPIIVHYKTDQGVHLPELDIDERYIAKVHINPHFHNNGGVIGQMKRMLSTDASDPIGGLHLCPDRSNLLNQIDFLLNKDKVIYKSKFKDFISKLFPSLQFVDADAPAIIDGKYEPSSHITICKDFRYDGVILTPIYSYTDTYIIIKPDTKIGKMKDIARLSATERRKVHQSSPSLCKCNDCAQEYFILNKYVSKFGGDVNTISSMISSYLSDEVYRVEPIETIKYQPDANLLFRRVIFGDEYHEEDGMYLNGEKVDVYSDNVTVIVSVKDMRTLELIKYAMTMPNWKYIISCV